MTGRSNIKNALEEFTETQILYDEPMSQHCSLCVGGETDALVIIENENQLFKIVQKLKSKKIDFFPVGNLTNVIVRDGGYRGAILLMKGLKKVECHHAFENYYNILAQAGASLTSVVNLALFEELTGLEFCAGIPGSVGGAVRMNAGAYGNEIKDVLESVYLFDEIEGKKELQRKDIFFEYRNTVLPERAVILAAKFRLERGQSEKIKERMTEIIQWRQEKHPLEFPNAGSIFKNIPGQPAGKIIEEIGLKGKNVGDAQISSKHANFIINKGKAKAADVLKLIKYVQDTVKKENNINLETEVVIIGEG